MKNIIKIFRKMFKAEGLNEKKIDVDIEVLKNIASRCKFEIKKISNGKIVKYFVIKQIQQAFKVSDSIKKEKNARFACLSDIHAGFKGINLVKLEKFLKKAQKYNVEYVLIAGDLAEGIKMFNAQEYLIETCTPSGQAKILFDVLSKYDFHYIIINGNHDYSFETSGMDNPNEILNEMMKENNKKMTFLDTFYANVIINGIGIRIVHLDDSYGKSREYPCIKYTQEISNQVTVDGKKYPIHAVVAGHIHKHEIHQVKEILVLQPGSIKEKEKDENARIGFIISLTVEGDKIKELVIM